MSAIRKTNGQHIELRIARVFLHSSGVLKIVSIYGFLNAILKIQLNKFREIVVSLNHNFACIPALTIVSRSYQVYSPP
jgi:hypothetical protein